MRFDEAVSYYLCGKEKKKEKKEKRLKDFTFLSLAGRFQVT